MWAFLGLVHLRCHGFMRSKQMEAAARGYRAQNNPARDFLTSHYTADPAGVLLKETVYRDYAQWAQQHGHLPVLANPAFGTEVARTFPAVQQARESAGDRRYRYAGLTRKERNLDSMGSEDDAA